MPIDPSTVTWDDAKPPAPADVTWDDEARPAPPRTFTENLSRQLKRTLRAGVMGTGSGVGAVGDAVAGVANLLQPAKVEPPSQNIRRRLNELLGLDPSDETTTEKVVDFGTEALAGGMDPLIAATQRATQALAPSGFKPAQQTAKDATTKELHQAGIKLLPTEMGGGAVGRSLEGAGGQARIAQLAQSQNQPKLQALAALETGLSPKNLTQEALESAARVHIRTGYEPLKQFNNGRLYMGRAATHPYQSALDDIANKFSGIDESPKILKRVENLRSDSTGYMRSEAAIERLKQLRSDASDAFRSDKTNYGRALREMADELEKQIERNLPKNSELLTNFRSARTALAKNYAVRDMLVDPNTGVIDPVKAATMLENGTPLTGGLQTIAKAGSALYRNATKVPIKGEGTPINWGDMALYGIGGTAAPFTGGMSLALAGMPVARAGARHLALSDPAQALMARGLMGQQQTGYGIAPRIGAAGAAQFGNLFQ